MPKVLILLFYLQICWGVAPAQLRIKNNGNEINYQGDYIRYGFTAGNALDDSIALQLNRDAPYELRNHAVKISERPQCFWLVIPLKEMEKYGHFDLLHINNPHINFLRCWIVRNDSILKAFQLTGDNTVFNTRPIVASGFLFPVQAQQYPNATLIIASDKRYTKLDLPIEFCSTPIFLEQQAAKKLLNGIFLGLCVFLLAFNTYFLFAIRERLFLWYSIYLLTIIVYANADQGLLFQFIYPLHPEINDVVRPSVLAFGAIPLLFFFNDLLQVSKNFPRLFKYNKRFLIGYLILLVIAVSTSAGGNYILQGFWVKLNRIIGPLWLVAILVESIYCYIKKVRFAIFAVLSFSSLFLFITIFSLQQSETIAHNAFTANANYWGIVAEIMVVAFSLAWRYKLYKEDVERLYKENLQQQEALFKGTAHYQETEMRRLSSILHDTVGANLGLLRLETDNMELTPAGREKIAAHISSIGNEIRQLSHTFSPITLREKGLQKSIEELIGIIRSNSAIHIQYEWIGNLQNISNPYAIIIYRIVQELIQNILKHARAQHVMIQIISEGTLISIYVEDDGIGCATPIQAGGVGLRSMEELVGLLKGNFQIKTAPNQGFNLSIEFNQLNHEHL